MFKKKQPVRFSDTNMSTAQRAGFKAQEIEARKQHEYEILSDDGKELVKAEFAELFYRHTIINNRLIVNSYNAYHNDAGYFSMKDWTIAIKLMCIVICDDHKMYVELDYDAIAFSLIETLVNRGV